MAGETLLRGLADGLPALRNEIEANGTADDIECARCVDWLVGWLVDWLVDWLIG